MFLAGLVVAQFASGLAAQASASRLLYAMGRNSVLPKAVFGRLSEKFHTPVANLVVTGIVGLNANLLDVATSTSFINFGAFIAFTLVNASVVILYLRQRRWAPAQTGVLRGVPRDWRDHLRLPALPAGQHRHYAVSWMVAGVVVLALITRGFKAVPLEMTATEKARLRPLPESV